MPSGGGGPSVAPGGAHTGVPIIGNPDDGGNDDIQVPFETIRSIMKPRAQFNSSRDSFRSRDGFRARDILRSR